MFFWSKAPKFGNNDDRVDRFARKIVKKFSEILASPTNMHGAAYRIVRVAGYSDYFVTLSKVCAGRDNQAHGPRSITVSLTAMIFDIKHYAIHDGPGVRTTVFFKGCPLTCQWCSNPESQRQAPEVSYNQSLCTLCQDCAQVRPNEAVRFGDGMRIHDRERCTGCGQCVLACPSGALEMCGYMIDEQALWENIEDDRAFWDLSGPPSPAVSRCCSFVSRFLALCKSRYGNLGYVPESDLKAVLPQASVYF